MLMHLHQGVPRRAFMQGTILSRDIIQYLRYKWAL
jgi:hypothetical protein